jgi:hypothetical protein
MKMVSNKLKREPDKKDIKTSLWQRLILVYPFAFSVAPILSLYATNMEEIDFSPVLRSLLVSLLVTAIFLFLLQMVLRDWGKSGLIVSVGLILFFSYGQIYKAFSIELFGVSIVRHRFLVPLTLLMFLVWSWWVVRHTGEFSGTIKFFNLVGGILLLVPLTSVAFGLISHKAHGRNMTEVMPTANFRVSDEDRPDIYYIVLDGYGRGDVLRDLYDLDNAPFLSFLESEGFYVVSEGRSNYMQTLLSLGSSLNMDYLTNFEGWESRTRNDLDVFRGMIRHSKAREIFQTLGYKMVAFETGYKATNISDADIYLNAAASPDSQTGFTLSINPFEDLLLETSMGIVLRDFQAKTGILNHFRIENPYVQHRNRVTFILSKLGEVSGWEGDYFVFAHIISPHAPFVFNEFGGEVPQEGAFTLADANLRLGRDEYIQRYRNQLEYLNSLVEKTIKQIIARSKSTPIIIIQGDHGPAAYYDKDSLLSTNLLERFSILNAILLPGHAEDLLYDSITPVNSFRVILNQFFGYNLLLLQDRSYFATYSRPFDFIDVTDKLVRRQANPNP